MQLLLHPRSRQRYDAFVQHIPQSILLVAPEGSGKYTILQNLAHDVLGDHAAGRVFVIEPEEDKTSIGIDAIRELKISLRLKSASKRIVIIAHAEQLTIEAQNSFMKLLEEPPENIHFLLAVPRLNDVLETIQSRVAIWQLIPPTSNAIQEYFKQYDPAKVKKAIAIGDSRIGAISSLLAEDTSHELLHAIEIAKELLSEGHFERLVRVDALVKDKQQTSLVIDALQIVCKAALEHAAVLNNQSTKQWHKRLSVVSESNEWLQMNIQSKLVLCYLFMQL